MGGLLAGALAPGAEPSFSTLDLAYTAPAHSSGGLAIDTSGKLGRSAVMQAGIAGYDKWNGGLMMTSLGVGGRWQITPSSQLALVVSGEFLGGSHNGPSGMEDDGVYGFAMGAGAGVQVRGRLTTRLAWQGQFKVVGLSNGDDSMRLTGSIGARYYLSNRMAVGADLVEDFFGTRVKVGVRLDLGRR